MSSKVVRVSQGSCGARPQANDGVSVRKLLDCQVHDEVRVSTFIFTHRPQATDKVTVGTSRFKARP